MTPVSILITIVAYFIIPLTVSYIAGRKADNEGFFVGNRKSAWYVVAFAMIGSKDIRSDIRFRSGYGSGKRILLFADGTRFRRRANHYRLCFDTAFLPDEFSIHL